MSPGQCHLPGYHILEFKARRHTTDSRGGLGYTSAKILNIEADQTFPSIFVEIQWNNKSIIIGTIYRPNTPPKAEIEM